MLPAELIFVCLEQLPEHEWTRFRLVSEGIRKYIDRTRMIDIGKVLISDDDIVMVGKKYNTICDRMVTDVKIGSTIRAPGSADHVNKFLDKLENLRNVAFETLFISEPGVVVLRQSVKCISFAITNISLEFDRSSILSLSMNCCPNIDMPEFSEFTSLKWFVMSYKRLDICDPLYDISHDGTHIMYQIIDGKKELALVYNTTLQSSQLIDILPAYGPYLNCSESVYISLDAGWQQYLFPKFRKPEN